MSLIDDYELLLQCSQLCELAYRRTLKQVCVVGNHSFVVKSFDNYNVIAFAGTANIENLIEDVSIWPRKSPSGALVHAGVMDAFLDLEKTVCERISPHKNVIFSGHSLGGGIAQIFAEKYKSEVVTFGSLKIHFKLWKSPKLNHKRIVCDDDPVPLLPAASAFFLYSHNAEPLLILKDKDKEFIDIKDHRMKIYTERLRRLYENRKLSN